MSQLLRDPSGFVFDPDKTNVTVSFQKSGSTVPVNWFVGLEPTLLLTVFLICSTKTKGKPGASSCPIPRKVSAMTCSASGLRTTLPKTVCILTPHFLKGLWAEHIPLGFRRPPKALSFSPGTCCRKELGESDGMHDIAVKRLDESDGMHDAAVCQVAVLASHSTLTLDPLVACVSRILERADPRGG